MEKEFQLSISAQDMDTTLKRVQENIDNIVLKESVIEATTENFTSVIASAQPHTTVKLIPGDYTLLTLLGVDAYAEGLTIEGTDGVNMDGVIITSGQHNGDIFKNSDISGATMPRGLTFRNITFTNNFNAHNCAIEDLTVDGCIFTDNTHLWLNANRMNDEYDNKYGNVDKNATSTDTRWSYCALRYKNLTVKGCTFNNAYDNAIYVSGADGVTVAGNTVNGAEFNAVQITSATGTRAAGKIGCYTTGVINITGNVFNNTGSRSIRLSYIDNADIHVGYNNLKEANLTDANDEYAKLNLSKNSIVEWVKNVYYKWFSGKGYVGLDISVDNGIVSEISKTEIQTHMEDTNNPHNLTSDIMSGAHRQTVTKDGNWLIATNNDYIECWGSILGSSEEGVINVSLPFSLMEHYNFHATILNNTDITVRGIEVSVDEVTGENQLLIWLNGESGYSGIDCTVNLYCMTY